MENYFKAEKVFCRYETSCRNKSKSFCSECSRNFNRVVRDWFEPTEQYSDILNRMRDNQVQISEENKTGIYSLKSAKLPQEQESSLMDCFDKD